MDDLLDLVDDHTEYFKGHLETFAPQERRVYLALADLWKPATAAEIADRSRLDTSKVSAYLKRLTERGAVEVTGGTARRRLYYLSERLYNIYYPMRRSRGPDPLIQALIRFMEAYYSPVELKHFGARIAFEAAETRRRRRGRSTGRRSIGWSSCRFWHRIGTSCCRWRGPWRRTGPASACLSCGPGSRE